MKVLNLYCGIGGNRKLWENVEVTAVEYNKEIADIYLSNFPNDTVILGDAHEYLLENYKKFDFIWSSPPCPSHSEMRRCGTYKGQNLAIYPDMGLYQEIILLKYFANKNTKWVVENVKPYYPPLIKPQAWLGRHIFWTNFYVRNKIFYDDSETIQYQTAKKPRYGFNLENTNIKHRKDQILRNLVNPEIGKYLMDQSKIGIKPIFNL